VHPKQSKNPFFKEIGEIWTVGVDNVVVLACALRATTKKRLSIFWGKKNPQRKSWLCLCCHHCVHLTVSLTCLNTKEHMGHGRLLPTLHCTWYITVIRCCEFTVLYKSTYLLTYCTTIHRHSHTGAGATSRTRMPSKFAQFVDLTCRFACIVHKNAVEYTMSTQKN